MSPILTTASTVVCPHGGQAILATGNSELLVDGAPALLITDVHPVVGCPFAPLAPSPCLFVRWASGALQTAVHGVPVVLQESVGLCLNAMQAPQGPAIVMQVQQQAKGL